MTASTDPFILLRPLRNRVGVRAPMSVGYTDDGRAWLYWSHPDGTLRCLEVVNEKRAALLETQEPICP